MKTPPLLCLPVYARFALRLSTRSQSSLLDEQARAVQELLIASNPTDGVSGKWVLRRKTSLGTEHLHARGGSQLAADTPPSTHLRASDALPPPPPFKEPPGSNQAAWTASTAAKAAEQLSGTVRLAAVHYTRRRILAFQNAVMGGGAVGSAMPLETQVCVTARIPVVSRHHAYRRTAGCPVRPRAFPAGPGIAREGKGGR